MLLISFSANSQDEFASTAFYLDFKKIYADAQTGFIQYRGDKKKSDFDEIVTEYQLKFMLPLADSGKIVFPQTGNPYAVYYFEPNKNRLKVDQRAMSLRDAIVTACDKPLYLKSESVMINDRPYTNTWLFFNPNETTNSAAAFRLTIYFEDKIYRLLLEIRAVKGE